MGVNQGHPYFSLSVFRIREFHFVASVESSAPITVRVFKGTIS